MCLINFLRKYYSFFLFPETRYKSFRIFPYFMTFYLTPDAPQTNIMALREKELLTKSSTPSRGTLPLIPCLRRIPSRIL